MITFDKVAGFIYKIQIKVIYVQKYLTRLNSF